MVLSVNFNKVADTFFLHSSLRLWKCFFFIYSWLSWSLYTHI